MTWTYSPAWLSLASSSTSSMTKVRLLVGDTISTNQQLQDEEIYFVLTAQPVINFAAADCADILSARYAFQINTENSKLKLEAAARHKHFADLAKRIESAQRIIDRKREVASTTEHKSSVVEHSNRSLARTVAFFTRGELKPNETIETGAELSANLMMALAGTGVPAFALFVAGLYRREEDINTHTPHAPRASVLSAPQFGAAPATSVPAASLHEARAALVPAQHTREIVRTDNAVWGELRNVLRAA